MKTARIAWILCSVALLPIFGCGKSNEANPNVIATVNGEPITRSDLERDMAMQGGRHVATHDQLDIMIHRKLLLQEAMRRRLPERESFVHTIRNFWEQTLVKELMDQMSSELQGGITIGDAELQDYYSKLDSRVVFQIAHARDEAAARQFLEDARAGKSVVWDTKVGPSTYDEINVSALQKFFAMPVGAMDLFAEGGQTFVIRLESRQALARPPLEEIREKIKALIRRQKGGAVLDQWLENAKSRATIKIFTERCEK